MSGPENKFRAAVGNLIKRGGGKFVPIESGATMNGIPDAWVALSRFDCWIEFKYDYRITFPYEVKFRPGQYPYLMDCVGRGAPAFLMIKIDEGAHKYAFFKNEGIRKTYTAHEWNSLGFFCDHLSTDWLISFLYGGRL